MSFLDKLRSKRRQHTSVLLLFRMQYARSPDGLFVFFEGDDDELYFLPAIRRKAPAERAVFSYVCDGKSGVLDSKGEVEKLTGKKDGLLFFVDKDFDEFLGGINYDDENVFITEYYSVENYVVNEATLKTFNNLFIRLGSEEYKELEDQFRVAHARFTNIMLPYMVLTIALKRKHGVNVNLNNVNLANLIRMNDELIPVKQPAALTRFLRACGCAGVVVPQREYRKIRNEVKDLKPKRILRGKFELWFFIKFLKAAWEALSGARLSSKRVVKVTFDPSLGNLFAVMSGNLFYPSSLDAFLDRHLGT